MTQPILTSSQLHNGVWQGIIECETQPHVAVHYRDETLADVTLERTDAGWTITVPVPTAALSDGVHSFVVVDSATTEKLADFTVIAGASAADDLRAELELLRAELDMLKRALRRVCNTTD
ncbi:MAG: hypothetical protein AAF496_08800 [Pseudomonadota bacterium]